jgi:hypothetical protein
VDNSFRGCFFSLDSPRLLYVPRVRGRRRSEPRLKKSPRDLTYPQVVTAPGPWYSIRILPPSISLFRKLSLIAGFAVLYALCYVIPNFFPRVEPVFFHLFEWEARLPFLPWTFIIYTSDYFLIGSVCVLLSDAESFYRFARQAYLGLCLAGVCFWLYPTGYLRPSEVPESWIPGVAAIAWFVRKVDAPTNCFPSFHIILTLIATLFLRTRTTLFKAYSLWTALVFVSVLTTKQHYFLDILGGIGVVLLVRALEPRLWFPRALRFSSPAH